MVVDKDGHNWYLEQNRKGFYVKTTNACYFVVPLYDIMILISPCGYTHVVVHDMFQEKAVKYKRLGFGYMKAKQ